MIMSLCLTRTLPVPLARMLLLSKASLERAEMALDRLRREFDRQVRKRSSLNPWPTKGQ
jgi:hypothetical protein